MLALLKKDFFVLRKTCLIYFVLLLFYIMLGAFSGNFSMFQAMFTLIGVMLPVAAISYDERAKWDKYGMSLPLRRSMAVMEKYLFAWIAMAVCLAGNVLVTALSAIWNHEALTAGQFAPTLAFTCLGVLVCDLSLPVIYQLGSEKGRIALMVLIWGAVLIPMLLVKVFQFNVYDLIESVIEGKSGGWMLAVLFGATVLLTAVSLLASFAIYARKEFC